jgi:ankyrin repeat protein
VQLLLGLDPELAVLPDMTANTPLHWACESGNAPLVQQLLQYKPQLDMQNLNMCEYSTGQWLVGDDPIMPLDKVRVCTCHMEMTLHRVLFLTGTAATAAASAVIV